MFTTKYVEYSKKGGKDFFKITYKDYEFPGFYISEDIRDYDRFGAILAAQLHDILKTLDEEGYHK